MDYLNSNNRRNVLQTIMGDKVYCGLDIGSQMVKASLIKRIDPDRLELLGVFESKTKGITQYSVSDLGEIADCINKAVGGLVKKTGVKVKDLHIGIGGDLVKERSNSTVIPLLDRGSKVIGSRDIKKVNNQVRLLGVRVEEEILHHFPQLYRVDDVNTAVNPRGLYGRKLEVNSLLILANVTRLRNIVKAVNQAGFEVAGVFFTSFAAASVSLNEQAKKNGCALIDIGAGGTNVLFFYNGCLQFFDRIDFGGEHITQAIAKNLRLPMGLAEDIKKSYAIAIQSDPGNEEDILVKRNGKYMPIKRQDIYDSFKSEVDEFVESIDKTLESSKMKEQLNEGLVIVGGGAFLAGLIERIEGDTGIPAKLGKVTVGTKSLNNAPVFSASVGVAKLSSHQSLSAILSANGHPNRMNNLFNKIKELYQEYF